ncbi:MAG: hypothetical protein HOC91_19295 [Nitrospinaceae bacterium]|nr:hypothetical protein [Nitrospinaceae bacterium]MBT3432892.1 hypothetical protein [Nitrospinaceae bacterium]MBT3822894.1 hypothetical protein [Nitrospinaceae bacterium]MBT4092853.1 hypothetical protein [Nitrospinaceae bacterium]MBT4432663.1 hypothetical protein [Nitrospinaceae bacterium]
MKTAQKTIRLPDAVDKAFGDMARAQKMEPADLMADVLSEFALKEGNLGKEDNQQVRAETKLKKTARELAQKICAESFEPNVTLRVFQRLQKDPELRTLYEKTIGADGKVRGNHTKARINRALGSIIKVAVGGTARTEEGNRVSIQVNDEFIFNYTPLMPTGTN